MLQEIILAGVASDIAVVGEDDGGKGGGAEIDGGSFGVLGVGKGGVGNTVDDEIDEIGDGFFGLLKEKSIAGEGVGTKESGGGTGVGVDRVASEFFAREDVAGVDELAVFVDVAGKIEGVLLDEVGDFGVGECGGVC